MKRLQILIYILVLPLCLYSQAIENGIVKEYHGKEEKTVLPGVELMVKGAPSTVSDRDGKFILRFATLESGAKIDYTEIYKDGFVIFNKDALDAWRISNNEAPFTIIMCKEADFRALKKKFYGIIEKSYYDDYQKQLEIARRTAANELELRKKLTELEEEFNEKMSNINTYVELFSRIDRNEMDSTEARALEYMEEGKIDQAIEIYEDLKLDQQIQSQLIKWDAANDMHNAADSMIKDTRADLILLVDKMQKQLSLYEMGGYRYYSKRIEQMDNLISLLYRIRPLTGSMYNELLGTTIIRRHGTKAKNGIKAYQEAASLPSYIGRKELAQFYECLKPTEALADTIRRLYIGALDIINNPADTAYQHISDRLLRIPEGFYRHTDGNSYPYRILPDGTAELMGRGPYYSTAISDAEVALPDHIVADDSVYTVTGIGTFAFGRNSLLRKVILPVHCKYVGENAFYGCDSLTVVADPELDSVAFIKPSSFPGNTQFEFTDIPLHPQWILDRYQFSRLNPAVDATPLQYALARHFTLTANFEKAVQYYTDLIHDCIKSGNFDDVEKYITELSKIDKKRSHTIHSLYHAQTGNLNAAIKEAKKGLDKHYPASYQILAHLHVMNGTEKDLLEAQKVIDEAISLAETNKEKAMFLDKKGEIYLIQGNEDEARRHHDLAINIDRDYFANHPTKLYKHFKTPAHSKLPPRESFEEPDDSIRLRKELYSQYATVVKKVADDELKIIQSFDNLKIPEYEELESIGFIAMNSIFNRWTNSQIIEKKDHIPITIKWAIRHELPYRYPWYSTVTAFYESFYNEELIEAIKEAVRTMPKEYRECFECFRANGPVNELYSKEIIQGMYGHISKYLKEHNIDFQK